MSVEEAVPETLAYREEQDFVVQTFLDTWANLTTEEREHSPLQVEATLDVTRIWDGKILLGEVSHIPTLGAITVRWLRNVDALLAIEHATKSLPKKEDV